MSEATEDDLHTFNFMITYESVRKQTTGLVVYFAIPRGIDPRNHKNWVQFEKARIICDQNNIEYQDWVIAQFIGIQNWKECPLPMPNMLSTEGAFDRYSKCVIRWQKISERSRKNVPVDSATVEYYEEKIRDYVQKMGMSGVKVEVNEYIALMTGMGLFPQWFANRRVPHWKSIAEKLGVNING
jgi:hypothetical protein